MESIGYTLWLIPTGGAYRKFTNLITKLAGENNAPKFEPHVTLLGGIMLPEKEIIQKTRQLVSGQTSFIVNLQEIDYEDYFFRTLFVRVEKTNPLLALYNRAKEIFQMQEISSYMPHLSILYGTYSQAVKEKIIQGIGKDQTVSFDIHSIYLIKGGEVKNWKIIREFTFS